MGFNMKGDKNSLAFLSSKRVKAYTRTRADEAFALPSFSDAMPSATTEPQYTSNAIVRQPEHHAEHDTENVKQTMLQHESLFKEQLHELHRLYQKQCTLMAESKKGHACHPRSEPPSSNSSPLCNPDAVRSQEDGSFGEASVPKFFDRDLNLCAFPSQVDDVNPYEVIASCEKQGGVIASCEKQDGRPMFDSEHPAEGRLILDLERPAEEFMDVEVVEAKPQVVGITFKLGDVSALVHSHDLRENRVLSSGENTDFAFGDNRGLWQSNQVVFRPSADLRKSDDMCEDTLSSKEKYKAYSQLDDMACKGAEYNEMRFLPMAPSITLNCSRQESLSPSIEAVSASGHFRGLPDLNGELNSAEQQASPMEGISEKNVKGCQYIDLVADSKSPYEASNLPHWLCQASPTALTKPLPFNFSAQTSDWQQKTTLFSSQMHDKTDQPSNLTLGPGEIIKTLMTQEPYYPWSHSGTSFQQGEIPFMESSRAPFLRFFSGASAGAAQGAYKVAYTEGLVNENVPSFLSRARDSKKVDLPNASGYLSSHSMDRQGLDLETCAASTELLSRISSREATTLSTFSPWYQQRETFSSLMHQASNPEPPIHRPSHTSSVNSWGTCTSHRVLPMERGMFGMHINGSNMEDPSPLVTTPDSSTKGPVFDFMHANSELGGLTLNDNMKGNETTTWRHVEEPFSIGQEAEKISSTNDQCDLNSRRNLFDLNVSIGQHPVEENFDACHFTESRFHVIQKENLKQECETSRSSGWQPLSGIKAPQLYEQQTELDLQATSIADRLANKLMASDSPTTEDMIQPQNDSIFFTKADTLCFQGDMLGNDACADYCSGEDETGGGFVEVKCSDGSGLTSCESKDAVHLELTKVRDYSNTSSGEACQSRESRIPHHKEDAAFSSNVPRKRNIGFPLEKVNGVVGSQDWESFLFSTMQSTPDFSPHDTKRDCSKFLCTEFGDESEASNSGARKHLMETAKAAELLLSLGFDRPSVTGEGYSINDHEKSLDWLADIIPSEGNCEAKVLDAGMAFMPANEGRSTKLASEDVSEKILDPFELAVLALKPINPDIECLTTQAMEKSTENCPPLPNLRRRPSRRGRGGRDFQREMLRSMISLSRHEITEDFQIIEGLVKSTTEAINSCSLSPEDKPLSSPELGSLKDSGNPQGTKACRGRKLNGILKVCSWGESTRRKRMGRQRSQWLCLPPGVQTSLFLNNAGDGLF